MKKFFVVFGIFALAFLVLKVSIKERDLSDLATDCDNCCRLMPIEYTASTAEEIESLKGIEINYEGKNHTACFEI